MLKYLGDYLLHIITLLSAYLALCEIIPKYYGKLNEQGTYAVIFLGLLCFWYIAQNLYLTAITRRRVRYSYLFKDLNIGFSALHQVDHDLEAQLGNISIDKVHNSLNEICTNLAIGFRSIKGSEIGVCIKLIAGDNTEFPKVITLCRDKFSEQYSERPTGGQDTLIHTIAGNTDFKELFENIESNEKSDFYLNNNLPYTFDYKNTRLDSFNSWPPKGIFGLILRWVKWPLGYKSTLVLPIVPYKKTSHKKDKIRGFLCIDCNGIWMFNKHTDVEILKGISDGIYSKIDILHTKFKRKND